MPCAAQLGSSITASAESSAAATNPASPDTNTGYGLAYSTAAADGTLRLGAVPSAQAEALLSKKLP